MNYVGETAALVTAVCWAASSLMFGEAARRIGSLSVNWIRLASALVLLTGYGVIARGRPLLGICLGLQLLYEASEEAPGARGLALLEGTISLLPLLPGLKRPNLGWSPVEHASEHPVIAANRSGEAFYFVHSYAATTAPDFEVAHADHGHRFVAMLAKDNLVATQFHPEKSQEAGARLLAAWLRL